jgi:Ran GTPase-activating protein (RanGAP) involved in mRNA processing and transport
LIAEKLKPNTSCVLLSLGNSSVSDEGLKNICDSIKTNNSLITIGLGNNKISDKGLLYLGEALRSHKSLVTIGLGNNSIGDQGIKFLCEGLKENQVFQDLLLYNNKLTCKSCEYLSDLLKYDSIQKGYLGNKLIKKLYLGSNKLKSEGISILAQALKVNETLENLGLSHCEIENEGIVKFAESLGSNTNSGLKYLALGNNLISSVSVKVLFKALAECKGIQEVSLEWNNLDDECVEDVVEFLKKTKGNNFRKLFLNNNKFSDKAALHIAEFIVKCSKSEEEEYDLNKLEFVVLSNNNVSEKVKSEICKLLVESKCSKLKIK